MDNLINTISFGDSIELMGNIESNSIDLTVTSPPYDNMRTYKGKISKDVTFEDNFSFPFTKMAKELFRITKDGGILVWVVGDQVVNGGETGNSFRQALKFQEIGFKIYDTMIYHKNGAPFPETGRYSQVFEYMFVFLKGKRPNTVNIIKDKENKWAGSSPFGKRTVRSVDGNLKDTNSTFVVSDYGSRYNVWYINNGAGFSSRDKIAYQHPAIFPESLAEDHILSWSNEGDIVFDPMVGSGTTAKMAKMNNRKYIGFDINSEYVDLSLKRLESVKPYNNLNKNPKLSYIVTREEMLTKRRNKRNK
jgi:DNA modification methylase